MQKDFMALVYVGGIMGNMYGTGDDTGRSGTSTAMSCIYEQQAYTKMRLYTSISSLRRRRLSFLETSAAALDFDPKRTLEFLLTLYPHPVVSGINLSITNLKRVGV